MDHVLFEAMQTAQPRQKRSSTLDAAPPMPSQIGANLSRERQLMAASGESVGVVTAHRLIRTSLDGSSGSARRVSSTSSTASTAGAAAELATAESSTGSMGRSSSRIRRGNTPQSLEPDDRIVHRSSAPATGSTSMSTSTTLPASSISGSAPSSSSPSPVMSASLSQAAAVHLLASVFFSPPDDDIKSFAQQFADSVLAEFCEKHCASFASSRVGRLLRSCETTEDQEELKKRQKQIAKKFTVFDLHIGTVEHACSAAPRTVDPMSTRTLKRSQWN